MTNIKPQISFASVLLVTGLGNNKNVLYPRPITLGKKDICGFIGVMGLTCSIKLVRFFLLRDADVHSACLLRQRGWLGGCLAHAGIVSIPLNLS